MKTLLGYNKKEITWSLYFVWVYIIMLRWFQTSEEQRESLVVYWAVYLLLGTAMFFFMLLWDSPNWEKEKEEYAGADLNDKANLPWYIYDVYSSKERIERDLELLYQSPPKQTINTKNYIVRVLPLQKGNTLTHTLNGTCYKIQPGDIVFHNNEEFMVITTFINTELGVPIMSAGLIKIGEI